MNTSARVAPTGAASTSALPSWLSGHLPLVVDLAPSALLAVFCTHELTYEGAGVLEWVLVLALVAPLAWRRRAPVVVFAVCFALALTLWALRAATLGDLAMLVALYTVAAHRPFRIALAAAVALEVGAVLLAVRFAPPTSIDDAVVLLSGLVATPLFLGTTLRAKRRYLVSVEDRARRLERERLQEAQLAAAAERTRIARELHDIIAHGLAVVITLSEGAAASVGTDPEAAEQAMRQSAGAGRTSLAEMRRLLEVLRTDDAADRGPQPDLSRLEGLLDNVRRTGLDVSLEQHGDAAAVSSTAQATLYRVVQEALTNVLKHARAATSVNVLLTYEATRAGFAVADDGRPGDSAYGVGRGLVGMRERVGVFGGTLRAGPSPTGWLVSGDLRLR